jgi:hypothetical protein
VPIAISSNPSPIEPLDLLGLGAFGDLGDLFEDACLLLPEEVAGVLLDVLAICIRYRERIVAFL